MTAKPRIVIDGAQFDGLAGFFEEFAREVLGDTLWGKNLDAFNDVLRGGFGSPEGGFVLVWRNAVISRQRLGIEETIRWCEERSRNAHPSNHDHFRARIERLLHGDGPTLFDDVLEIIRIHGPGGEESEDGVELVLE